MNYKDLIEEMLMNIIFDLYPQADPDDYPDIYDANIDEAKEELIKLIKEI
jgi:hypothetical protein